MTATLKKLPKSEIELTITVPYADYLEAQKKALEDIGKELKVDGFRPGHIPEAVIKEKVNEDTIQGFTMERVIPQSYAKAVKEHEVQVIAQPKVEVKTPVKNEGDDLVYTATVAVMPEVKLGDYKKIKIKLEEVKVTNKEVDETIQMLMQRFATWKDVNRAAKNEDRAELNFEGFDQEGKAIPNTASKNHPVILGSKSMIPGFEEEVVGMKVGDKKEFNIQFPKDYHAKQMQGQKVKFKLELVRLEEKEEQKLDESLVEKMLGQKQSVDDFKKRIEEDLMQEKKQRAQADADNKVVEEIIKITTAEVPEILIKDEVNILKEERKKQIAQQGLTWEQYLTHVKKTDEDFEKDHQKSAEQRVLARLGVNQIIKAEKIAAEDADVDVKVQEIASRYPEESRTQVLEHYKKGSEAYLRLKNGLAADKLIQMFMA